VGYIFYLREKVFIRNLVQEDAENIINLINKVYGKLYFEREYYEIGFIRNILKEKYTYWKGAFINGNLIAQMLFTIRHNTGYLKTTMVHPEFRGMGLITLLGIEMMKLKKILNSSILKCVYAIINEGNHPIIKALQKFNFKFLGRIPNHDNHKGLVIFGLVQYDFNWRIVKPTLKLSVLIYNSILSAGIKRIISASNSSNNLQDNKISKLEISNSEIGSNGSRVIQIFVKKGEIIAELCENQYQKCWYDFKFLRNNMNFYNKKNVFEKVLNEYNTNSRINSISFPIPIDDNISQHILVDFGAKYYAYLPFYYKDYDSVLLGFSKIQK
jgi:RimJ/RimL family protein N-acetyltransferase